MNTDNALHVTGMHALALRVLAEAVSLADNHITLEYRKAFQWLGRKGYAEFNAQAREWIVTAQGAWVAEEIKEREG